MNAFIEEIKLKLTGGVLHLELDDTQLASIVNASLREVQRYINITRLATLPFSSCMDLSDCKVSSVAGVYRADSYMGDYSDSSNGYTDPMYASQWQMLTGTGSLTNLSNMVYNYAAWNTLLQVRNTMSSDLQFRFDKHTNCLYINTSFDAPQFITVEYVPRYDSVDEIASDYWIDKIMRLAVANTKVILGRIRGRFTQGNALWTHDADTLLSEGTAELTAIREQLETNNQIVYGID